MKTPQSLSTLLELFENLPGVGKKTAERLGFFILKADPEYAFKLASALKNVKEKVKLCSMCCSITEKDPCYICSDPQRDRSLVCVVEEPHDVFALERVGEYLGVYHVLMGVLAPLEGIGPDELKVKELLARLEGDEVKEAIIATNPNSEGEATSLYLAKLLKDRGVKVTRIARGLPMGGDLEYADEVTLSKALAGRMEM